MKNFLKYLLATILGIIIASFILFFIAFGIISAMVSSAEKPVEIKSGSILKLNLNKEIAERSAHNPFESINLFKMQAEDKIGLNELLENIKKAKTDDNIEGIYLELTYIQARSATITEIRNALLDFKQSKKFIIVYTEFITQGAYYLATVADKIYMNPEGEFIWTGLSSNMPFFKGTLEKLGIEAQVIKHGKYKSAVEVFTNDKMSAENREQVSVYVNSIWSYMLKGISEQRKIPVVQLNKLADNLSIANPDDCIKYKFVDSLIYADQVADDLLKRTFSDAKEPEFVDLAKYNKVPKQRLTKGLAKNKIAVIYATGDVVSGKGDDESIGSETIAKALRTARTDTSIKAIVFRINSPGGSALASEVIWREANLAAQQKVLIASMSDLAASGGYYIACPAHTIMANPTTITGSIGVFGVIFNFKDLLNNKLGITFDGVTTNKHADLPTVTRSMNEPEKAFITRRIERIYNTFITHVAEGRKMTKAQVDKIAQGHVYTGADAIKIGLVDTLGGLNDAIALAAHIAKIKNYRVVEMPKQEDFFDKLISNLTEEAKISILKNKLGNEYKYLNAAHKIMQYQGIQALMFETEIK